ncbi:hypothetical protein PR048_005393 [Dryococelus australis]|uniref:Uncharacterized protein n=1 Tax=Dryococelus australis TaxID=614101 RepID=A0ABQ9I830_9NEOP|nr:hypothetical protein PR048_005393 [Dryococelus australis]
MRILLSHPLDPLPRALQMLMTTADKSQLTWVLEKETLSQNNYPIRCASVFDGIYVRSLALRGTFKGKELLVLFVEGKCIRITSQETKYVSDLACDHREAATIMILHTSFLSERNFGRYCWSHLRNVAADSTGARRSAGINKLQMQFLLKGLLLVCTVKPKIQNGPTAEPPSLNAILRQKATDLDVRVMIFVISDIELTKYKSFAFMFELSL